MTERMSPDAVEAVVLSAPLTEAEAVDAAACFHELLKRDDPSALTRTIEHVLKSRVRAVAPAGAGDRPPAPHDYSFEDMSDAECQHVMEHLFGISMTAGYRRADYDWFRDVLTKYFTRRDLDRGAVRPPPRAALTVEVAQQLADNIPIGMPQGERDLIASYLVRESARLGAASPAAAPPPEEP